MQQDTKTKLNKTQNAKIRLLCAKCNVSTRHMVVVSVDLTHDYDQGTIMASDSYQIVRCLGCDSHTFRSAHSNSEDFYVTSADEIEYDERVFIYPPRAAGRRLLSDSWLLPHRVKSIYEETHKALCSEMYILTAIGIRALVEAVCSDNDAQGKYIHQKIDDLVERRVLSEAGAEILHSVRSMGNEAAHEIKKHKPDTISTAFDVAENLLQNVYILPTKATQLANRKAAQTGDEAR